MYYIIIPIIIFIAILFGIYSSLRMDKKIDN